MSVYIFQLDTNDDQTNIETTHVTDHHQYRQPIDSHVGNVDIKSIFLVCRSLIQLFYSVYHFYSFVYVYITITFSHHLLCNSNVENNKSNLCILTSRLFLLVYVSYHCCFYLFMVQHSSSSFGCCLTAL